MYSILLRYVAGTIITMCTVHSGKQRWVVLTLSHEQLQEVPRYMVRWKIVNRILTCSARNIYSQLESFGETSRGY